MPPGAWHCVASKPAWDSLEPPPASLPLFGRRRRPCLRPCPALAADQPPVDPAVAVFYSISNSQPGLAGIDMGNFLIKQARQCVFWGVCVCV